jgi:predicted nuclease with TOPRIM domain
MIDQTGLILGIVMAVVFLAYIFWPENVFAAQRQKTRLEHLEERREQLYENLRDLNFEFKAGKYPDEDFAVQRAQLEEEAARLLAEIDILRNRA